MVQCGRGGLCGLTLRELGLARVAPSLFCGGLCRSAALRASRVLLPSCRACGPGCLFLSVAAFLLCCPWRPWAARVLLPSCRAYGPETLSLCAPPPGRRLTPLSLCAFCAGRWFRSLETAICYPCGLVCRELGLGGSASLSAPWVLAW